jgi:hypothetical protein
MRLMRPISPMSPISPIRGNTPDLFEHEHEHDDEHEQEDEFAWIPRPIRTCVAILPVRR